MHSLLLPRSAATTTVPDSFSPYGDNVFVDGPPYPPATADLEATTALRSTQRGPHGGFLQVLVPRGVADRAPELTDLSTGTVLAAQIDLGTMRDTVLAQPEAVPADVAGLATTGTWAWSRIQHGRPLAWTVVDGTRLGSAGTSLMASSVPISATADLSQPFRTTVTVAATDARYRLSLFHPQGWRPLLAVRDGRLVPIRGSAGLADLDLTGGGDLTVYWTPRVS
jgi:hypothetical protein